MGSFLNGCERNSKNKGIFLSLVQARADAVMGLLVSGGEVNSADCRFVLEMLQAGVVRPLEINGMVIFRTIR